MGIKRNSERLMEARAAVLPSTINSSKLSLHRLYSKCKSRGIAVWNDGLEYAEFIHALWNMMLTNEEFRPEAQKIEEAIGTGDAIQLLSDVFAESRKSVLN
ncbi:hypothetical protein [Dokdonia sinensis]|nr:hypothetical protein [Dokdonia sinensis]